MKSDEYKKLQKIESATNVKVSDLVNQKERTLVYGYTLERDTFHVYLKEGKIHRYIYDHNDECISYTAHTELDANNCVPNKRIYPGSSDYEFCILLMNRGVYLPFTTFQEDDRVDTQDFVGEII